MLKSKNQKIKVLMTAAEVAPIAKAGGLADVVGSLPKALNNIGLDTRIIMPKYGKLCDNKNYGLKKIVSSYIFRAGGEEVEISVWQTKKAIKGVTVYMIENAKYFSEDEIYYGNTPERFLFFSTACLEVLHLIDFIPDVIHCHDFHTGLIPVILKIGNYPKLSRTKTLYTIHNIRYQGKMAPEILNIANIKKESLKSLVRDAENGDINCMVQAILNTDWINTVSPTYAKEITTKEYAAGLERIINKNKTKLSGILNGLDLDFVNPETDKFIKYKYSSQKLENKTKNKLYLQKQLGLPVDKNIPMIGFISRLVYQKGIELFTEDLIKTLPCQFVFLGTGQKEYEEYIYNLARKFPKKVSANITFSAQMAQQIYASSDIFTVPSRFEPCGLTQMIAMLYGTVPVVRNTGGLKDTVDSKVGFVFDDFKAKSFKEALEKAVDVYQNNPKKWLILQKNGFKKDFSWNKSAREYKKLYQKIINSK